MPCDYNTYTITYNYCGEALVAYILAHSLEDAKREFMDRLVDALSVKVAC